jgi:hypothetical protein
VTLPRDDPPWFAKAVGMSAILTAIGFGGSMPVALVHRLRHGELPMTPWGFRAFAGPFDRLPMDHWVLVGAAFVVVSGAQLVAGVWLAQGRRRGAALDVALAPLATVLGVGYALPLWLAPIPVRLVAALLAWRRLH